MDANRGNKLVETKSIRHGRISIKGHKMRKTYRKKSIKEYWDACWDAVSADAPMQNAEKYPLSCSLDTLKNVSSEEAIILEAGCGTGRILRYFHEKWI